MTTSASSGNVGMEIAPDIDQVLIVFDGQGTQWDGMGRDIYEQYAAAREVFNSASEAAKIDMKAVCFGGLSYLLKDTRFAQPAIATVSLAKYRSWLETNPQPDFVTGLSMGLYTAVGVTAIKNKSENWDTRQIDHDTVKLVAGRAAIMHDVSIGKNGAMVPVIGPVRHEVRKRLQGTGANIAVYLDEKIHTLTGTDEAIERAKVKLSTMKATILDNLPIHQAAHSALQKETVEPLSILLGDLDLESPRIKLASNSATYLETPQDIIDYLLDQMTQPADWHSTESLLINEGVTIVIQSGSDKKRSLAKQMVKNSGGQIRQVVFPAEKNIPG